MKRQLLHTPEGVRDIYNSECEKKLVLQEHLHHSLKSYGYHMIQTPSFEFFDIFGKEIGTTPSKELYKFFDREGNTLVLRPDMTPSIARSAAKYFMDEEMPIRLCYMGNVFSNCSSYQGRLKETTQLGAELIGDNSVEADAEIINMAVDCMCASGLKDFQLSIGHINFLQGLVEAAGLNEDAEEKLRNLIENKNFFGVEEFISPLQLNGNLSVLFGMLGGFYNSIDKIVEAKQYAEEYPTVWNALERLEKLDQVLKCYGVDKYISYELGLISNYHYYTGVIFSGYTFGSGQPIVKGGRYDQLLSYFGKESPSIGFGIVIDQLMVALSRQQIEIPIIYDNQLVLYSEENLAEAVRFAKEQRSLGINTEMIKVDEKRTKADYEAYAKRNHIAKIIDMDGAE